MHKVRGHIAQVDSARQVLMKFWKDVRRLYRACKLTADGGDFFSPNKRWLRLGNEYRGLVEPLDIANWYKAGNHEKGSGHYWGEELASDGRVVVEVMIEIVHQGEAFIESLFAQLMPKESQLYKKRCSKIRFIRTS
jgi:hypothetical protein